MKVLRILTRPNVGGPTRQAANLWHAQTALGHQCLTITGAVGEDEASFDLSALGIPRLDADAVKLESSGYVQIESLVRSIQPLNDLRAYFCLRRLIRAFDPDVVHTHTSKAGWIGRTAAMREAVPIIAHTFHGHVLRDYYPAPIEWGLRRLERWLAKRTQLLYAISDSCAEELRDLAVSERCQVIRPAVDTTAFAQADRQAARRRLKVDDDRLVLAFVGRLAKIKRVDIFAEVLRAMPDAVGVVFGDGPCAGDLAGISNLRHLGTQTELENWLPGCDLLVMPSMREGFPLAAVEAAAAGIPTLGFDVPGLADVVALTALGSLVPKSEGSAGLVVALRAEAGKDHDLRKARELCDACEPQRVAELLLSQYEGQRS